MASGRLRTAEHRHGVLLRLDKFGIPYLLTHDKAQYDPLKPRVSLLTMHNSKGLEFNRVIIAGVGEARLLYIAMTRAMQLLLFSALLRG